MLTIPADDHEGHIQITTDSLPHDAKDVVVFFDAGPENASRKLSADQLSALQLQSQSGFAQTVLLNSAEDCWNNI